MYGFKANESWFLVSKFSLPVTLFRLKTNIDQISHILNKMLISNKLQNKNISSVVLKYLSYISFCWFKEIFLAVGHGIWLIMNTYSNLFPTFLICSDFITAKYIVKLLIIVLQSSVQVPSCGFLVFVNYINCDLSHDYKGRYWFTRIADAKIKMG